MRLKLNGKDREVADGSSVEDLVEALGIHRMIVVEHNGTILSKEQYPEIHLQENDELEIVHMVGGG